MTSPDIAGELCEQGLNAELAGHTDEADGLYRRAWDEAQSPFGRCLAAHYRARTTSAPEEKVRWTHTSVEIAAQIVGADDEDERIYALLPSLQIAHAAALFGAGDQATAQQAYVIAADFVDTLHGDTVDAMVLRSTIYEGLTATGFVPQGASQELYDLIASLKANDAWGPLAVVLGAHVQNSGTDEAAARFVLTLRDLYGAGLLKESDQELLRKAIQSGQEQLNAGVPESQKPAAAAEEAGASADPGVAVGRHAAQSETASAPTDDGPDVAFKL